MKAIYSSFIAESDQIRLSQIASGMIVLNAFFLPLSTAITTILIFGIVILWLLDRNSKDRWQFYRSYPLTKPIFFLIALSFIGMFHTIGSWETAVRSWYQISKLGIIPILAYYLQDQKYKKLVLSAFVAALIITIITSMLKAYGLLPIGNVNYGNTVFKNHIVVSYFMATSLFFLCVWCDQYKQFKKILLPLIGLTLYYFVFLNTGRIGYIILYICFAVYAWHKYRFKGIVIIFSALSLILFFAYQYSDTFYTRVDNFFDEFQMYLQGKPATSIGARIEFIINSITLFLQHPLNGFGSGSFKFAYITNFASTFQRMTVNPHNQYLYTAVELGGIGLILLFWLFCRQWKLIQQLSDPTRILAQGIFLSFVIGCIFNSWLKDFTECYFYCLMTAYFIPVSTQKNKLD
ncbi:MAG: O-antigen ligase family protein [Gammaproteobacteria bacterium]|nr:O-antigen ligase family protein [Gammaproteobacteria bacterium]